MASPNTLALRAARAHLHPQPWYLNRSAAPRSTLGGEFPAMLAEHARIKTIQRRTANAALVRYNDTKRGLIRTVPVSGPGRRRAKAHRNCGLCMQAAAGRLCRAAAAQYERCEAHLTDDILAAHSDLAAPTRVDIA